MRIRQQEHARFSPNYNAENTRPKYGVILESSSSHFKGSFRQVFLKYAARSRPGK
jgi:hypothetical protein